VGKPFCPSDGMPAARIGNEANFQLVTPVFCQLYSSIIMTGRLIDKIADVMLI
jgi:hypothetical protein